MRPSDVPTVCVCFRVLLFEYVLLTDILWSSLIMRVVTLLWLLGLFRIHELIPNELPIYDPFQ